MRLLTSPRRWASPSITFGSVNGLTAARSVVRARTAIAIIRVSRFGSLHQEPALGACRRPTPDPKASNVFPENNCASLRSVPEWSFLTNHARVLLCVAHDPGARLRDIAASLGITERTAHGIITDLAEAGYVVKQRDGRRNRYRIEAHLPLREPASREPAIGEVLAVLLGSKDGLAGLAGLAAADRLGGGPADGADVITAAGRWSRCLRRSGR